MHLYMFVRKTVVLFGYVMACHELACARFSTPQSLTANLLLLNLDKITSKIKIIKVKWSFCVPLIF